MLEKSGYVTLALPYWNIKGNYFSEGKIMKLAKTVIVSGLLFSSVLGSVNIGSITAMAADNAQTSARALGPAGLPKPGDTSKPITKKTINIKYADRYGVEEKRTNFVEKSQKTIEVNSSAQEVSLSNITLPEWYVFLESGSVKIDSNNTVTIKVKKNKVDTTGITELTPPEIITPDEQEQQSHEPQLTAPDIVSVGKPGDTINKPQKPTPAPKPSKRPSAPRYTIQRVRITFVDQNSKDLVGYKQVTGKASFSTKIEAPKGYSFTNAKDATIKFDKKGNKDIKVFVKKMTSAPVKHEGIITTTNGSYKRLYTLEGKMITNRALGVNSKWYTDQYATINGEKMYRVATNEWVKASDVL